MRIPQVSIRQIMVGIACGALVIPGGVKEILEAVVTFACVYCWLLCLVFAGEFLRNRWMVMAVFVGFAVLSFAILVGSSGPTFPQSHLPNGLICVVTPIHLIGPIYVARQLWRGTAIGSGEILWGYSGLAWMSLLTTRVSSHYDPTLNEIAGSARILSALALWFCLGQKRHQRPDPVWPYYLGWALVEYDAVVWGWYGATRIYPSLR